MITSHTNGLGFNPLLQDPALAIHPPLLYIGYVGFSAAFSLSVAAMSINVEEKIPWHSLHETFCISRWIFLSAGIALVRYGLTTNWDGVAGGFGILSKMPRLCLGYLALLGSFSHYC
jgi:hypothetical protein